MDEPRHVLLEIANAMDSDKIGELENHELMLVMRRMSTSGKLQVDRTLLIPEAYELTKKLYASALKPDPFEWLLCGAEMSGLMALSQVDLLKLFSQTQKFAGYDKARASCKLALSKLSVLKQHNKLAALTPGTVEFDIEYFFFDFTPWNYKTALIVHQGAVSDAAGRGDLEFFKRLYNKVKNDQSKKAAGQYEHFLTSVWLHGFFWLMPDKLACAEVVNRLNRVLESARTQGLQPRKTKKELKLDYATAAGHEAQRKRFREAVKNLGLYQHPESPLIGVQIPGSGMPNTDCFLWKEGWPK